MFSVLLNNDDDNIDAAANDDDNNNNNNNDVNNFSLSRASLLSFFLFHELFVLL